MQLVLVDRAFGLMTTLANANIAPDIATWNALIKCASASGQLSRTFRLLDDMVATGLKPNERTFVSLINACCREGEREMALRMYRCVLCVCVKRLPKHLHPPS